MTKTEFETHKLHYEPQQPKYNGPIFPVSIAVWTWTCALVFLFLMIFPLSSVLQKFVAFKMQVSALVKLIFNLHFALAYQYLWVHYLIFFAVLPFGIGLTLRMTSRSADIYVRRSRLFVRVIVAFFMMVTILMALLLYKNYTLMSEITANRTN